MEKEIDSKRKQKIEDMRGLVFISFREVHCLPADSVASFIDNEQQQQTYRGIAQQEEIN